MAYRKLHHRFRARGEQLEPRLPLAAVEFIPHVVSEPAAFPEFVDAADIDGDNDTDLVTASDESIQWYENINGKGDFGPPKVVAQGINLFRPQIEVADLDSDGDMDVVVAIMFAGFEWYENVDGQGTFGPGSGRIIAAEHEDDVERLYSLAAADLDSDGDMDVLTGGHTPRLAWYENTTGEGTFGPPQAIANVTSSAARSVAAADLDGDGDMDILAVMGRGVSWYENTDGRGRFRIHVIGGGGIRVVFATDVDTDGDLDVLYMTSEFSAEGMRQSRVVWHENVDGRATFGQPQQFTIGNSSAPVAIADVDGDGDQDVIAASTVRSFTAADERATFSSFITWYENDLSIVGDANGDDVFNQLDIVQVLQAGKFRTGEPATWEEGDWNADAVFDRLDIVAALQAGCFDPA